MESSPGQCHRIGEEDRYDRKAEHSWALPHHFIKQYVKDGDFCIDATAGRGHDTAFLCRLVGEQGCVTAFDIQQDALNSTDSLLRESGLRGRARLILDSHENMEQYVRAGNHFLYYL